MPQNKYVLTYRLQKTKFFPIHYYGIHNDKDKKGVMQWEALSLFILNYISSCSYLKNSGKP